jgi:hypothetical protein
VREGERERRAKLLIHYTNSVSAIVKCVMLYKAVVTELIARIIHGIATLRKSLQSALTCTIKTITDNKSLVAQLY